ncbi:MAG TPA: ribosome biogenesis GTPase Der [Candidatus Saccharibacteria bacterium]|nr:ribosome biogenesis GTPase Der [Candidatus Saccharibacteria bacterium]
MAKRLPIVAIVGRANVGKSSLFNTIIRRREAIVADEPGTTRDSIMAKGEHGEHQFWLVDTAGMKDAVDDFEFTIQDQILQAADSADVIWVVIEAPAAITTEDRKVAKLALKTKKPVFLVVNKADRAGKAVPEDYQRLGIKPIILTAATQNQGITDLLDNLVDVIPQVAQAEDDNRLRVAILGRPNVGKSLLFNTLAKKQQAIVADRAGTTRDINRTVVKFQGREIELLDTAGIRRSGKIERGVEKFSVIRSLSAIEQADICLLVMDVNELNVALDQKIAGLIKEAGKGLVLVVSKWDSVEDKTAFTRDQMAPRISHNFEFVPWAPLIFTSSISGQNVTKLFELALEIDERRKQRMTTSELNQWLRKTVAKHPPAGLKNRSPKLNYIVQETDNPIPAFKIFGAHTKFLHWSYKRFLDKSMRHDYDYVGSPIQFWFIEKHETHKHGTRPTE